MYITSNDNYYMISLATWYNKHLKIYHQIALENTPTVSLKSKHKVSNIPYPLQRLSTPYPYATWWVTKTLNLTTQISLLTEDKKTPIAVIDFVDTFRGEVSLPRQVYVFYLILGNFSGAINPFIYGFLNRSFRREYGKMFSLRKRNSRRQKLQVDLTSFSTRNPRNTELTTN